MFIGDIFDPFAKVKSYLKIKENHVFIDNWIYLLHRKWSLLLSVIALLIIFSYPAMIEQPIVCFGPSTDDVPKDFLDEWCWLSGTYIVPQHIDKAVGKQVVQSGVGPDDLINGSTDRLYHHQYIFYPMIFLLQLGTFYCSKYSWMLMEGGRLKHLLAELTTAIIDDDTLKKRINMVTDYMTTSPATFHRTYAYRYIFCEMLNAFNIIFQFWAIDKILHDDFLGFGWDAVTYLNSLKGPGVRPEIMDPFTKLFPKLALCHFTKMGPSGNPIPLEALCVLPLNNVADKIFLVWWFWLVILGFITIVGLIYRGLLLCSPCARYFVLRLKTRKSCNLANLKFFVDNSSYGDWFVLSLMQKNMDSWAFSQLLRELVMKMGETRRKRA